jgi:hypothetical protein
MFPLGHKMLFLFDGVNAVPNLLGQVLKIPRSLPVQMHWGGQRTQPMRRAGCLSLEAE